jgi:hypothetical protein
MSSALYHPADKLPESESDLRGLYLSVLDGQSTALSNSMKNSW